MCLPCHQKIRRFLVFFIWWADVQSVPFLRATFFSHLDFFVLFYWSPPTLIAIFLFFLFIAPNLRNRRHLVRSSRPYKTNSWKHHSYQLLFCPTYCFSTFRMNIQYFFKPFPPLLLLSLAFITRVFGSHLFLNQTSHKSLGHSHVFDPFFLFRSFPIYLFSSRPVSGTATSPFPLAINFTPYRQSVDLLLAFPTYPPLFHPPFLPFLQKKESPPCHTRSFPY